LSVPLAPVDDAPSSEEPITAERDETKYLVHAEHVARLSSVLGERLPAHRFSGQGANRLPDPHHYITTVYFDTLTWKHYEASRRSRDFNVKLRARDYYDVHPSLAELATRPSQVVKHGPWIFFEVKQRKGSITQKTRFRLPRSGVSKFVSGSLISKESKAETLVKEAGGGDDLVGVMGKLRYIRELSEPLLPRCLVNYRRVSWQDADSGLRLTLDLGVAFYAPPDGLWKTEEPLVRSTLGKPRGGFRPAVLEVKRRTPLPDWLSELLESVEAEPSECSKFISASEAVGANAA
jgi:SPX domain protein involved in polyphosphate accumulation